MTVGGFFAAVQLLWELLKGAKELAGWVEKNRNEKWFQDSAQTFSEWRDAKSPEQKKKAAENLRDLIRRIA